MSDLLTHMEAIARIIKAKDDEIAEMRAHLLEVLSGKLEYLRAVELVNRYSQTPNDSVPFFVGIRWAAYPALFLAGIWIGHALS